MKRFLLQNRRALVELGRLLCHNRKQEPYASLGVALKDLARWFDNYNYDFATNGEKRVVDVLARFDPRIVIDVGANVGEWSRLAAQTFEHAIVHAFEIVPRTFEVLRSSCEGIAAIVLNNTGLDEQPGEVAVNVVGGGGKLSSAYPRDPALGAVDETVPCKVTTLDAYIEEQGITSVDFLKIDAEGMDHRVLKGAQAALGRGMVNALQFEYGMVAVETRFLLKDFFELLSRHGFVVGKIFPTHVDFRSYHRSMEDFIGPNFLAVRSELPDMIDAFSGDGDATLSR